MYSVSNDFLTALHAPARFERIRGTVGSVSFDDSNIISLSYSNRCSDTADVTLGSCYIGQLEATFTGLNITRGDWRNKVISLEWGLVLEDESVEYIPVGVFTVTEATWSGIGVSVKASDNISLLDKACSIDATSGSLYDLLSLAALTCGLTLAQTQAQIDALPNGDQVFSLYPDNDIKTWRDFVSWVAQLCAGFAYADRAGSLAIKSWYDLPVVDTLTDTEREYQTTFSDYATKYDGISYVDIANQATVYVSNGQGGSVINIGSNPFLQYGTKETLSEQGVAIAEAVGDILYTPFNSGVLSNIAYDLGDILTCSGGIAGSGTLACCVMAIDWTSKNLTTMQGFGADPSLTSGKSKTDKALDGLMRKTNENQVVIHTFENAQAFTLGDEEEVEIIDIRFATISPKVVNIWHEIELDVTANDPDGIVACQAIYYLNEELIAYSPVTTWNNDGLHLLHLLYFIKELLGGTVYEWQVYLKMIGGTATIARGDIHASLYGQGLVASDTWDGYLDASDNIVACFDGGLSINFTENVSFTDYPVENITASDTITAIFGGGMSVNFTENVQFFHEVVWSYWVDDEGDYMTDEDDNAIIFMGID